MTPVHFLAVFTFILLAAAPGRTTFVLILLASQGHLKKIFLGAAAAFLIQSLIAVLLGGVLALLPRFAIELMAGLFFLYFGFSFWKQSLGPVTELQDLKKSANARASFILVFMAEFGDVSQLAIAAAAAGSPSKPTVFAAAVTALWILTAGALFVGHHLKRVVKPNMIQKGASIAFFGIGAFLMGHGALLRMPVRLVR